MRTIAVAFVVFACALGAASAAEAGRIPLVYQSGLESFESGPLPAPYDSDPAFAGYRAGYVCDVTGLFLSYFSIGDCRPAAVLGNSYKTDNKLAAAVAAVYPSESIPFWGRHGWKIMLGGLLLLVIAASFLRGDTHEETEEANARTDGLDVEGLTERTKPPKFDPKLYAKKPPSQPPAYASEPQGEQVPLGYAPPQIQSNHAQQFAAIHHAQVEPAAHALGYRQTEHAHAVVGEPRTPRAPTVKPKSEYVALPFAETQPLGSLAHPMAYAPTEHSQPAYVLPQPHEPAPQPPRRPARGSYPKGTCSPGGSLAYTEHQYRNPDTRAPTDPSPETAGHTQLGWRPAPAKPRSR